MKATYIDHMGTDLSVVNAARVSFGKISQWDNVDRLIEYPDITPTLSKSDQGLIAFLARGCTSGDWEELLYGLKLDSGRNPWIDPEDAEEIANYIKRLPDHWTPFGHTAITLHIKAPIFVARQLGKHQVGMVWNEVSRRYISDDPEFYRFPEYRMAAPNVKQGSSSAVIIPKGQKGRCPVCSETFTAKSNRSKYCSPNCQGKGRRSTPEGWSSRKVSTLKKSAIKRGINFSLTKEDIPTPTHCSYLGTELKYNNSTLKGDSASVDRIDNSLGYVSGNIQTISNKANTMKNVATDEEIIQFSKSSLLQHGNYMVPQVDSLNLYHEEMRRLYRHLIDNEKMCPEQARGFMPQTLFTEWYWTGNLYSFANVFIQRTDSHAQREVQDIAKQIGEIIQPLYPVSWEALTK